MMETEVISIHDMSESIESIQKAARVIQSGGLVVFPTETVYGLGADATSAMAAEKIYRAKGRPSDNPLIIHIATPSDAEDYTVTSPLYYRLAERFMPGPLTVILLAKDTVPLATRGGLDTVAVRCPAHPIANALIRAAGVPIAAPSANLSGSPSPTTAKHVIEDMRGRCDVIIDGGDSEFGLESTIVKIVDDDTLLLLRPGKITPDDLREVCSEIQIAEAVTKALAEGERVLSPGMKYRHYAPKAPVVLLDGDAPTCIRYIKENAHERICVLVYHEELPLYEKQLPDARLYDFGRRACAEEQAHKLFYLLREADKENYDVIYAPTPEKEGVELALYNRMIRAAAYKIITLK